CPVPRAPCHIRSRVRIFSASSAHRGSLPAVRSNDAYHCSTTWRSAAVAVPFSYLVSSCLNVESFTFYPVVHLYSAGGRRIVLQRMLTKLLILGKEGEEGQVERWRDIGMLLRQRKPEPVQGSGRIVLDGLLRQA